MLLLNDMTLESHLDQECMSSFMQVMTSNNTVCMQNVPAHAGPRGCYTTNCIHTIHVAQEHWNVGLPEIVAVAVNTTADSRGKLEDCVFLPIPKVLGATNWM